MSNSASALRRSTISMLAFLAATALWGVVLPGIASAVTFTVNRNDDIAPRGTGSTCITAISDDCTLREAVIKLNATAACAPPAAACIINFATATNGTPILLTITSTSNAADASTGDLDINANVKIQGNGAANTVIEGAFAVADNKDNKRQLDERRHGRDQQHRDAHGDGERIDGAEPGQDLDRAQEQ